MSHSQKLWASILLVAGLVTPSQAQTGPGDPTLSILVTGDIGFNASLAPVEAGFGQKHGERIGFDAATAGVLPALKADIIFGNLETVVTDRNDLSAVPKAFNFRTHPAAVRHLLGLGFNVFSTANNHALDYGVEGVEETLKHLGRLRSDYAFAAPGLGESRAAAARPHLLVRRHGRFEFAGIDSAADAAPSLTTADRLSATVADTGAREPLKLAISAIGIGGGFPSGPGRAGQMAYGAPADFAGTLNRLVAAEADYRILSVHYGREFNTFTDESDITKLRRQAALGSGIDLVLGHHQHVVAGVEVARDAVIFYGLGNFIHFGTRDLSGNGICRDYGLAARVHLRLLGPNRATLAAIEAMPVQGTHKRVRFMTAEAAAKRIAVLNWLAERLDDPRDGAKGVRFTLQTDGTGLYCLPGAENLQGRIGALCRRYTAASPPSAALAAEIRDACGGRLVADLEE